MCTNCRWVYNKYIKSSVLVKCGHCPACIQDKAAHRATRIRNNLSDGNICLFITLTYDNNSVPYIWRSDAVLKRDEIPIYRDCTTRRNRFGSSYRFLDDRKYITTFLDSFYIGEYHPDYDPRKLKDLNKKPGRIGVCYYPDVQKFLKRLRQNLIRYGFNRKFSYFCCSEYGGISQRPHFHLLLFIPSDAEALFRSLCVASWPYADKHRTSKFIEVARNAASYVSSYVNSNSRLSSLLETTHFRQKHSYSQGFGTMLECFSLASILAKTDERNLTYGKQVTVDGVTRLDTFPIPKYVVNRFFPKFKGYGRLAPSTLARFTSCPAAVKYELNQYEEDYKLSNDDFHKFIVRQQHAIERYCRITGNTPFDYNIDFIRVWNLYESQKLILSYKDEVSKGFDAFREYYDNIILYLENIVPAPTLSYIDSSLFNINPNTNHDRITQTSRLTDLYNKMCKQKDVTNLCMTQMGLDV